MQHVSCIMPNDDDHDENRAKPRVGAIYLVLGAEFRLNDDERMSNILRASIYHGVGRVIYSFRGTDDTHGTFDILPTGTHTRPPTHVL